MNVFPNEIASEIPSSTNPYFAQPGRLSGTGNSGAYLFGHKANLLVGMMLTLLQAEIPPEIDPRRQCTKHCAMNNRGWEERGTARRGIPRGLLTLEQLRQGIPELN
jgi:hypothetical protein